ncbi:MAG: zinc ribbon domain-containing protein, partial [Acidobacteriota bacterium]
AGLLYCESCGTRMVYSYSGKRDRAYPYYVCLNAQRKGWAACPSKSLPARQIEDSVLAQIRLKQVIPFEWEGLDALQRINAIQTMVERVGFNGVTRQVSIRFHPIPAAVPQV